MLALDLIGAVAILLVALLAEESAKKWKKAMWCLFVVVVVAQTGLQIYSRKADDKKHERDRTQAIKDTSDRVAQEVNDQNKQTITDLRGQISKLQAQVDADGKELRRIGRSNFVTGSKPVKVLVTNSPEAKPTPAPVGNLR